MEIQDVSMDSIGALTASLKTTSLGFHGSGLVMIILGESCKSVSAGVRVLNWTIVPLECIENFNLSLTSIICPLYLSKLLSQNSTP